jgi:hypothetical protein
LSKTRSFPQAVPWLSKTRSFAQAVEPWSFKTRSFSASCAVVVRCPGS